MKIPDMPLSVFRRMAQAEHEAGSVSAGRTRPSQKIATPVTDSRKPLTLSSAKAARSVSASGTGNRQKVG